MFPDFGVTSDILASIETLLLDSVLKAGIVLAIISIIILLMRGASAASRHSTWTLGVFSLVLIPFLSELLPRWEVVPTWNIGSAVGLPKPTGVKSPPTYGGAKPTKASAGPGTKEVITELENADNAPQTAHSLAGTIATVWVVGVCALLLRLAASSVLLRRHLLRCTRVTNGPLLEAMQRCARRLQLRRPVRLYLSDRRAAPMTLGIIRPSVLLPADVEHWSGEHLECTLLHELAHVHRLDCLTQLATQFVVATYWLNPMAWFAAWRTRVECEHACDDAVIQQGVKASDYAEQLLCITSELRPWQLACYVPVSMTSSRTLTRRLRAILSETQNRRRAGRSMVAASAALLIALVVPLAMLHSASGEQAENRTENGADTSKQRPRVDSQAQVPEQLRQGIQRIHPSMLESPVWLNLKRRLEMSGMKYTSVSVDEKGLCGLDLTSAVVFDLGPLAGVKFVHLRIGHSQVKDLTPLKGMPLVSLSIGGRGITDLTPLANSKLTSLDLINTSISELSALAGKPLTYLDIRGTLVSDLGPLTATKVSTLQLEDTRVTDLRPLQETPVHTLTLSWVEGMDVKQIGKIRTLKRLKLTGKGFADLSALAGLKLESLELYDTSVRSLAPLEGMPVHHLALFGTPVTDLTPLRNMKIADLYVSEPGVDLSPVESMPLESIGIPAPSTVKNIAVLRRMPTLKTIRPPLSKPLPAAAFWQHFDQGAYSRETE